MPLGCLASLFGIREKPAPTPAAAPAEAEARSVPDHLPVAVKRYFFSQDENAFFRVLEEVLRSTAYRVFPNVRIEDLFRITDDSQRASVRGRLKAKHVDFLIVDASKDFQPVLALELDGTSHNWESQKYNDAVKDVIFRSAGLKLLRVPSQKYSAQEVRERLSRELSGLK